MVLVAVVVSVAVGEENTIILPGEDGKNDGVSLGWRKDGDGNPYGYLIHGETVIPCDGDCDCPEGYSEKEDDDGEKICVKDEIEGLKFKDGEYYMEGVVKYTGVDINYKNIFSLEKIKLNAKNEWIDLTTTIDPNRIQTNIVDAGSVEPDSIICSLSTGDDYFETIVKENGVVCSTFLSEMNNNGNREIITNKISSEKIELYFEQESFTGSANTKKWKTEIAGWKVATPLVETDKILIDGWKLSTKVPDYVFEQDYQLPELSETEKYIKENKHLPEIPSAKEIEKNGMDIAEMNILLLKKVEELTLHAIDQDKRIKELEKKIVSDKGDVQTK